MKLSSFAVLLVLGTFISCQEHTARPKKVQNENPGITKDDSGKVTKVDSSEVLKSINLSSSEKAEQLALAAEQLITPSSFMYANTIIDQALSLDAENKRAQFYKAFLATPMALKGIVTRLKPLALSELKGMERYDEIIKNFPNSGLKTFLLDGEEDIKDEAGLQGFLEQLYGAREKLRLFLKKNKDLELTLNLNDWGFSGAFKKTVSKCVVNQSEDGSFDLTTCDMSRMMQIQLNRADVETLQHSIAGLQIYSSLLTAYDVSGVLKIAKETEGQNLPAGDVYKMLTSNQNFGVLRHPEALTNISKLGMDAIIGLRWAVSMQKELCPEGNSSENNREGYLFSKGLCLNADSKFEETLQQVELALSGQSIMLPLGDEETGREVEVIPVAILDKPITDLKDLKPKFNRCGQVVSVSDDTLGGLFPNADANDLLAESSDCR